jgi:hypothetical protein
MGPSSISTGSEPTTTRAATRASGFRSYFFNADSEATRTAAALDEVVPPGSAVSDFHNTSDWMKMRVAGTEPLASLEEMSGRL